MSANDASLETDLPESPEDWAETAETSRAIFEERMEKLPSAYCIGDLFAWIAAEYAWQELMGIKPPEKVPLNIHIPPGAKPVVDLVGFNLELANQMRAGRLAMSVEDEAVSLALPTPPKALLN